MLLHNPCPECQVWKIVLHPSCFFVFNDIWSVCPTREHKDSHTQPSLIKVKIYWLCIQEWTSRSLSFWDQNCLWFLNKETSYSQVFAQASCCLMTASLQYPYYDDFRELFSIHSQNSQQQTARRPKMLSLTLSAKFNRWGSDMQLYTYISYLSSLDKQSSYQK